MKIAICISGHLRTFELTYPSLKQHILDKYDCDVFISTWKNLGNQFAYHCAYKNGIDKTDPIISEEDIRKLYKPVAIHMDDADTEPVTNRLKQEYNEKRTQNKAHLAQIMCMLYKIWDCNRLKKDHEQQTGKTYDAVIRVRFDVFLKRMELDKVGDHTHCISGHMGVADFMFVGPSKPMDDLCDIYTVMSPQVPFDMFENVEQMWATHIINNNIPFKTTGEVFEYHRYANSGIYDMFGKKIRDYSVDELKEITS
jgi:hypothetical protein